MPPAALRIRGHASPKMTKLYDRPADTVTVDEIERIVISRVGHTVCRDKAYLSNGGILDGVPAGDGRPGAGADRGACPDAVGV